MEREVAASLTRSLKSPGTMTDTNPRRFYVYAYLRTDGTPYYIGKGTGKRIHEKHSIGLPPKERRSIIIQNLTDPEACAAEIWFIAALGRKDLGTGILRNRTNGGDGISGYVHTESAKKRISASNKKESYPHLIGRSVSQETKSKISQTERGKHVSEETKTKIRLARKHQVFTAETRLKMSESGKGRTHTEESKQKMSKAIGRPQKWFHSLHGIVIATATELGRQYGVQNLYKLKTGQIKQSKGWAWLGAA